MTIQQVKEASIGNWESIAAEVRPSNNKNADGTLKPFYLTRSFTLHHDDKFELAVTNLADPLGDVPIAKMSIKGHIEWRGEHLICPGAQKVDFSADEEYIVSPLIQGFADVLNQYTKGFNEWKVKEPQSIFKKAFPPFGLAEGQVFKEHDLIHILDGMMFWGARNVDGRGFDTEENRPANLQIPMIKR
ncbi:MAG TPA: hypothetical protein VF939_19365 [Puia sp.]